MGLKLGIEKLGQSLLEREKSFVFDITGLEPVFSFTRSGF